MHFQKLDVGFLNMLIGQALKTVDAYSESVERQRGHQCAIGVLEVGPLTCQAV